MRNLERDFSAENLSSSFGSLNLTDDLAEFMKLSILMKCHHIHKDVHNVTIGPNSTNRATQAPEKRRLFINTKSPIEAQPKSKDPKPSAVLSSSLPRSTRNEANIIHMKTVAKLEARRQEELNDSIEKRRQKFIEFEQKQQMEKKLKWHKKQESMIQTMQKQEMHIKKVLEEHEKEIQARNKKIEEHYKQLAEKKIKEERELSESKKQVTEIVEGISKCQSEFTFIYSQIADDITNTDVNQRSRFANYVSTLDHLNQQLTIIVEKCKTSVDTLQQKDLAKCNELIDLAKRIQKQVEGAMPKTDEIKETEPPFPLQPPQVPVFNIPLPTEAPPPYQPAQPPLEPPPAPIKSSAFAPSTIQHTSPFIQNNPQTLFGAPPQTMFGGAPSQKMFGLTPQTIFGGKPQATFPEPPQPTVESAPQEQGSIAPPKLEKYVSKASLEKYVQLQNLLKEKEEVSKQILEDPSLKSFKNNCKKAVNTPVNTLTDATPHHLLDKYVKLNNVLSGKVVEICGERINVAQHPHGIDFCMDLLARKFVLQGDLIVSSNTAVSAFNYASVIITLWNDFPAFGDLLLGHFYRECPYLVPFYPPNVAGQTEEEFAKTQGYRTTNGELEGQDTFLKRMVGFMRLYAATLVAAPKQSHKGVSRQSMAIAWKWLASIMNLQPRVDVTAAMIHTFLETVGYKMQTVFGKQFDKLIAFLSSEYMVKIKSIDTEGPVRRLELLLQDFSKDGSFPEPEGMLPSNFW